MTVSTHLTHLHEDDSALVEAVQAGDLGAYEELFRRHHTSVKRVCARRLGNSIEADEVAQAAFVRAFERIDRCIGDRRFGAWVQVIARRLCVDLVRARTRTTPEDDPVRNERPALNVVSAVDAGTATEEALVRRERTARFHEALALLPDRQRAVVVARHLEGRRPPEIAAALGLSVGAVDSLLLRARRRLAVSYEHVLAEGGPAAVPAGSTSAAASIAPRAATAEPSSAGPMPHTPGGLVRDVTVALPPTAAVAAAATPRTGGSISAAGGRPLPNLPTPAGSHAQLPQAAGIFESPGVLRPAVAALDLPG